jgi:hypothetical protein
MEMPKAPVNEDRFLPTREHNVRGAWQLLAVEAESVPYGMEQFPYGYLGTGVFSANPRH